MKKGVKIALIIIGAVLFLFIILNFLGILSVLNEPLNKLIAGEPDKSCTLDSDCVLRKTNCRISCGGLNAVNRDYQPFCLFKKEPLGYNLQLKCEMVGIGEIKCVSGQCEILPEKE